MINKSKKILTEISAGELLDKISILEIKLDNIKDKERLIEINKEHETLIQTKNSSLEITKDLQNLIDQLKKINMTLWAIENKKRMCENNKDFDAPAEMKRLWSLVTRDQFHLALRNLVLKIIKIEKSLLKQKTIFE